MAQSTTEIQRRSDAKRGVKVKGLKLTIETIELLERLTEQTGDAQATVVTKALIAYAEALEDQR